MDDSEVGRNNFCSNNCAYCENIDTCLDCEYGYFLFISPEYKTICVACPGFDNTNGVNNSPNVD